MKKESRISQKIRKLVQKNYGTILHKTHGGAFGETGAADLYGTLPGGRAVYIEMKTPDTRWQKSQRSLFQHAWLDRERKLGALVMVADSYEEIAGVFKAAGIYPHGQ